MSITIILTLYIQLSRHSRLQNTNVKRTSWYSRRCAKTKWTNKNNLKKAEGFQTPEIKDFVVTKRSVLQLNIILTVG